MITKEQKIYVAQERARVRVIEKSELERQRAELLDYSTKMGVGLVHIYDKEYPKGGVTVAFRKTTQYKSGVMVEVAVATCSTQDSFSKKIGTVLALAKFADGETIYLPINCALNGENLAYNIKLAFSALYFSVN